MVPPQGTKRNNPLNPLKRVAQETWGISGEKNKPRVVRRKKSLESLHHGNRGVKAGIPVTFRREKTWETITKEQAVASQHTP